MMNFVTSFMKPRNKFCNIFPWPIDKFRDFFLGVNWGTNFTSFFLDKWMNLWATDEILYFFSWNRGNNFTIFSIDKLKIEIFSWNPLMNFSIFSCDWLTNFTIYSHEGLTEYALFSTWQNSWYFFKQTKWQNVGFFSCDWLLNFGIFSWLIGRFHIFILRQLDQIHVLFSGTKIKKFLPLTDWRIWSFSWERLTNLAIFFLRPIDEFCDIFPVTECWNLWFLPQAIDYQKFAIIFMANCCIFGFTLRQIDVIHDFSACLAEKFSDF